MKNVKFLLSQAQSPILKYFLVLERNNSVLNCYQIYWTLSFPFDPNNRVVAVFWKRNKSFWFCSWVVCVWIQNYDECVEMNWKKITFVRVCGKFINEHYSKIKIGLISKKILLNKRLFLVASLNISSKLFLWEKF